MTFGDHSDLKTLEILKRRFSGDLLTIDYVLDPETMAYSKTVLWRSLTPEALRRMGFVEGTNFMDNILYAGVKVYVRFRGFEAAEPPNAETSSTMYDYFRSDAQRDFVKGMTSISMPPMDLQKIGIIAAAIVTGILAYFMVFGV